MKRYLSGLVALGIAICAFAFTKESKKVINGKEVATAADPCGDANKRWFIINLECLDQNEFTDLTNAGNYRVSTQTEVNAACMGIECVCAVWACSTLNGQPMITSGSSIYTALSNYYNFGSPSGLIREKDQVWARRSN